MLFPVGMPMPTPKACIISMFVKQMFGHMDMFDSLQKAALQGNCLTLRQKDE